MLTILLTILHVIVSLILILVVLLQTGKRADLAGAFGGGGSQTAFGTRGAATFLSKMTTTAAVLFMLTCLGLSIVSGTGSRPEGSVLPEDDPVSSSVPAAPVEVPVVPEEPPADSTGDDPAESGD